ncbi:MAG: hypothetical protein J6V47_05560 [Bacteroidaceae bacterium]|nr:hypothetical protein [Bacteroidaceae bacterium]
MYKKMLEQARQDGVTSEKTMWASIENINELLELVEEHHPDVYKKFMRRQHELLYGPHYNELLAMEAVASIAYTDKDGKRKEGAYWTVEQIEEATRGMSFPAGTTKYDKYVAFNSFRSDVCKKLDDTQVLQAGYAFYFADEDYIGQGKIWQYMGCVR